MYIIFARSLFFGGQCGQVIGFLVFGGGVHVKRKVQKTWVLHFCFALTCSSCKLLFATEAFLGSAFLGEYLAHHLWTVVPYAGYCVALWRAF